MSATYEQSTDSAAGAGRGHPAMWVLVGVLGAAVAGLTAALIWMQKPASTPAPVLAPTAVGAPQAAAVPNGADKAALPPDDGPAAPVNHPAAKPVDKRVAAKPAATPHPGSGAAPAVAQAPAPAAAPVPVRAACVTCGIVESVVPVQREAPASGVGAVAGGVLGAVVGNQVGSGGGRAAATILGAVGGGVLGNTVEKRMKKVTVYQIGVRMEGGQLRTVERASAVAVGTHVTLDGQTLRTQDGTVVPDVQHAPAQQPAPAGTLQTGG